MPREAGIAQWTNDWGAVKEIVTSKCCHCGSLFPMVKGSGTKRGFCMGCHDITCGSPACNPCMPFEKRLDIMERGLR